MELILGFIATLLMYGLYTDDESIVFAALAAFVVLGMLR